MRMSLSTMVAALEVESARKDMMIARLQSEVASKDHLIATLTAQLDDRGDRPLEIDFMHRLGLTKSEATLLGHLVVASGRPLDRGFIESVLPCRDHAKERGLKIVDVTISKLRRKLPGVVQTVKGYGWRVDPEWKAMADAAPEVIGQRPALDAPPAAGAADPSGRLCEDNRRLRPVESFLERHRPKPDDEREAPDHRRVHNAAERRIANWARTAAS
jgi:hypothetical protein